MKNTNFRLDYLMDNMYNYATMEVQNMTNLLYAKTRLYYDIKDNRHLKRLSKSSVERI